MRPSQSLLAGIAFTNIAVVSADLFSAHCNDQWHLTKEDKPGQFTFHATCNSTDGKASERTVDLDQCLTNWNGRLAFVPSNGTMSSGCDNCTRPSTESDSKTVQADELYCWCQDEYAGWHYTGIAPGTMQLIPLDLSDTDSLGFY